MQPTATVCPDDGTDLFASDQTLHTPSQLQRIPAAIDTMVGKKIGEYQIQRRIGQGSAGVVYEALQPEIGRRVAIKLLRRDTGGQQELLEEARLAASIRHRGVIEVYGFGALPNGTHYIVMEFLEGQGLDAILKEKGPMHLGDAIDVVDDVLGALSAAHSMRVVHRDLKPSNIFRVRQSQGTTFFKVLDFGLAKRLRQGESYYTAPTEPNVILGTPDYMAPEQGSGADVTAKSDLYAVGCIFFELLTGRPPFTGKGPFDVALKHVTEPAPRLSSLMPSAHPMAEAIIAGLLEKDPAKRPASAEEARRSLTQLREALSISTTQPVSSSAVRNAMAQEAREAREEKAARAKAASTPPRARWVTPAIIVGAVALAAAVAMFVFTR